MTSLVLAPPLTQALTVVVGRRTHRFHSTKDNLEKEQKKPAAAKITNTPSLEDHRSLFRSPFLDDPWWWTMPRATRHMLDEDICHCGECDGERRIPYVAVRDAGDEYRVVVELPGFKKENLTVELEGDDVVCVTAVTTTAKKGATDDSEKKSVASTTRRIQLPTSTGDATKAKAKFEDGVLTVTLPKPAGPQAAAKIPIPFA
jgi:HSP20 family protein